MKCWICENEAVISKPIGWDASDILSDRNCEPSKFKRSYCKSCYDKWADESDSYNNDYKEPEEGENAPEYYNCSRCGEKAYYDDGYYPYCSNCANHPEKCPGCGMQMTEINGIYCCLNI